MHTSQLKKKKKKVFCLLLSSSPLDEVVKTKCISFIQIDCYCHSSLGYNILSFVAASLPTSRLLQRKKKLYSEAQQVFFCLFVISPTNNCKRKRKEVPVNDLKIVFFETTDETICRGCRHQFILIFERIKRVLHLALNRKGNGCVVLSARQCSGQRVCHISSFKQLFGSGPIGLACSKEHLLAENIA